jgi:uncharacterized protein YndB with AHSA1/START domain
MRETETSSAIVERETVVACSPAEAWRWWTEPALLVRWMGSVAEVDLRPGGAMAMRWKDHGAHLARIEKIEPYRAFAWRWARPTDTEPAPGNSTLVEFLFAPEGDGTRLRVIESGFASTDQSEEAQITHVKENTQGWIHELDELRVYAEKLAAG